MPCHYCNNFKLHAEHVLLCKRPYNFIKINNNRQKALSYNGAISALAVSLPMESFKNARQGLFFSLDWASHA